jgi:hypothetical protein
VEEGCTDAHSTDATPRAPRDAGRGNWPGGVARFAPYGSPERSKGNPRDRREGPSMGLLPLKASGIIEARITSSTPAAVTQRSTSRRLSTSHPIEMRSSGRVM